MPALHAALFDLDGTLIDSAPDLKNALNKTLRAHKRRELSLQETTGFLGDGMLMTLERAFALTGEPISPSMSYQRFQEFITYYRSQKADPEQIYPHVLPMLQTLQGAGVKIGLCTNKQEATTRQLIDELDLKRYFDFVAGGDTFQVHKPHPGHITGILDALNIKAEHTIMIGDSRNDSEAAKAASVTCVIVTHGYGFDVSELGANAVIDDFSDFKTVFARLGFSF